MGTHIFACGYLGDPGCGPFHKFTTIIFSHSTLQLSAGFGVSAAVDINGCLWSLHLLRQHRKVLLQKVLHVSSTWQYFAAICDDGRLVWGSVACCGAHVTLELPHSETPLHVAVGDIFGLVATASGSAFTWEIESIHDGTCNTSSCKDGANGTVNQTAHQVTQIAIQSQDSSLKIYVKQVACGSRHFAAITNDGQLFCWGWNLHSQCSGAPCSVVQPSAARRIALPPHLECVQIAAGHAHTVALCSDGSAYSWGLNADGQLGVGDVDSRTTPVLIELKPDVDIKQVACGARHTVVVTEDGQALGCGWGKWGQLAQPVSSDKQFVTLMTPMLPSIGTPCRVVRASCGHWSTLLETECEQHPLGYRS